MVDPETAEGVRTALATYTQALDDGRTDEVVATFCRDGVCEIPGLGTHRGHDALRQAYAGWVPQRPQRHLIVNTVIADGEDGEVTALSDMVFLLMGSSGWRVQIVGRYHDTLRWDHGQWRFSYRRAEFVTQEQDG